LSKLKALIFGGRGFVGQHLELQLRDRYDVVAVGREVDIGCKSKLKECLKIIEPSLVVNLASLTTVAEAKANPVETVNTMVTGVSSILAALSDTNFRGSYLQVSSSEVYGRLSQNALPVNEDAEIRLDNLYSFAKYSGEALCQAAVPSSDFQINIVRPFTHIGRGQSNRFAVAYFADKIKEIANGRSPPVINVGNLEASRDFTDVRDVVVAYDRILHSKHTGKVYNVCSGREMKVREALNILLTLAQCSVEIVEDDSRVRDQLQDRIVGDFYKIKKELGWYAKYDLKSTLIEMMRSNRDASAVKS